MRRQDAAKRDVTLPAWMRWAISHRWVGNTIVLAGLFVLTVLIMRACGDVPDTAGWYGEAHRRAVVYVGKEPMPHPVECGHCHISKRKGGHRP